MNGWYRVRLVGQSSTVSESSDPGETVGQSYRPSDFVSALYFFP